MKMLVSAQMFALLSKNLVLRRGSELRDLRVYALSLTIRRIKHPGCSWVSLGKICKAMSAQG